MVSLQFLQAIIFIIIIFNISLDACQIDASDYSFTDSCKNVSANNTEELNICLTTKKDENTKSLTNTEEKTFEKNDQNTKKPTLKTYFDYKFIDNMKFGKCKLCDKDMIKMKGSNTSGLKLHLSRNHKKEHDLIYNKQIDSKSQNKLDSMVKVCNILI